MLLERHFSLMSESIFSAVSEHFNSSKPGVPLTSEVAVDKGVSANADGSEANPHGDIPIVNKQGTKSSEVAVDKGVSANADGCESNSHGDTYRIADTQGTTDAIIAGKSVIVGEEHRCHSQALDDMGFVHIHEQSGYVHSPPNSENVARNQSPKGTVDQILLVNKSISKMSSASIDKQVVFDQTPITSMLILFVSFYFVYFLSVRMPLVAFFNYSFVREIIICFLVFLSESEMVPIAAAPLFDQTPIATTIYDETLVCSMSH
jgi:hypothetical protein